MNSFQILAAGTSAVSITELVTEVGFVKWFVNRRHAPKVISAGSHGVNQQKEATCWTSVQIAVE